MTGAIFLVIFYFFYELKLLIDDLQYNVKKEIEDIKLEIIEKDAKRKEELSTFSKNEILEFKKEIDKIYKDSLENIKNENEKALEEINNKNKDFLKENINLLEKDMNKQLVKINEEILNTDKEMKKTLGFLNRKVNDLIKKIKV